jgi:hypothetical protein
MNNLFEQIRTRFSSLGSMFKGAPKDNPGAVDGSQNEAVPPTPNGKGKIDRFAIISWVVTLFLVVAMLGSAFLYKNAGASAQPVLPQPTASSNSTEPQVGLPVAGLTTNSTESIQRNLQLKTIIPERPRYASITYRVSRGDGMWSIAEKYKVKSETILYANSELDDNPHNLKPGMELIIPPVDGLYYKWQDGDTFESIAHKFEAKADDIINFPGNNVDLTDPVIKPPWDAAITAVPAHLILVAIPAAAARSPPVLDGRQMHTAFPAILMGLVTWALISPHPRARTFIRQVLEL